MSRRTTILMAILTAILCSSVTAAGKKPLKVYILAGQSNMEGQAKIETFDYIGDDPKTAPLLKEMRGPDGKPRVCGRAWISYLTGSPVRGTLGEGFGKLTAGYGSRRNPKEKPLTPGHRRTVTRNQISYQWLRGSMSAAPRSAVRPRR